MQLKLLDGVKAAVFGLPPFDTDSDTIIKAYETRGWNAAETMRHIQAAIEAGAYQKENDAAAVAKSNRARKED